MVELGKIERPEAKNYKEKRKIYFVPNIFLIENEEYKELFNRYWQQVSVQVDRLEIAGVVNKIFCEILTVEEEKPLLDIVSSFNNHLKSIIEKKMEKGATLIPLEEKNIFFQYLDWGKCLSVISTQEVFDKVYPLYRESYQKRLDKITEIIDKNLAEGEAGLLILKDEDRLSLVLPTDIELFLVIPPAFDDINKWFRQRFASEENIP